MKPKPAKVSGHWSAEEDALIRTLYAQKKTRMEMAAVMGRTEGSVRSRCCTLGLNTMARPWRKEEIATVAAFYEAHRGVTMPLKALCEQLGRSKSDVSEKASQLGLTDKNRQTPGLFRKNGRVVKQPLTKAALKELLSARAKALWQRPGFREKIRDSQKTPEARRKAAEAQKRSWENGRVAPCPWRGKAISPERKRSLSVSSRRYWANLTKAEVRVIAEKRMQTRIDRYGTPLNQPEGACPYTNCKRGRRKDLEDRYFRSKWEANIARYLNLLKERGEVMEWEYEPKTFVFHGETRGAICYTPDFLVTESGGVQFFYEVKGWEKSSDRTKQARMRKHYPEVEVRMLGSDTYKSISQIAPFIPGWEY